MRRHQLFALIVLLAVGGCTPGLAGRWDMSGTIDEPAYQRFSATLIVGTDGDGVASLTVPGQTSMRVPVCAPRRRDGKYTFTLETAYPPELECGAAKRPVAFEGDLGAHVVVGRVLDADGEAVGMWRAYRARDEK